jgi:hypothetical protein
MEFIKLRRLLQDVMADRVTKVGQLATLVREVSQVLENLGLPPILEIPWDLGTADDILGVVDVILVHVKEAYDSVHGPGIRCREPVTVVTTVTGVRPAVGS